MQAPRNWRNKVQRYRLTGVQYSNGESSLINRPQNLEPQATIEIEEEPIPATHSTAA